MYMKEDLSKFAPEGTKKCQAQCDRKVVMTSRGPVVVCFGCERIVMDHRKKRD